MPAVHLRTDAPLHAQLVELARAEGLSLNTYLVRLVQADVGRRQRLAATVGRDWRATDAELANALGEAVSTPLSDIEQSFLPADPGAAVAYAAGRAAYKRRNARTSKPAPSPSGRPAASPGTAPQAWRDSVKASLAGGHAVRITGATLELRAAKAESLPAEFRLFTKGVNESTNGSVLFDARSAQLTLEQAARHGVDFMLDLEHRSIFSRDETSCDAMGWFTPEVRKGELWATRISWTDVGAERLRSRRQRYTSPAFYCAEFDDKTQLPRVTSLINCAICSMPATYQIAPLVASRGGK